MGVRHRLCRETRNVVGVHELLVTVWVGNRQCRTGEKPEDGVVDIASGDDARTHYHRVYSAAVDQVLGLFFVRRVEVLARRSPLVGLGQHRWMAGHGSIREH
jgi:hypothetical protein